MWYIIEQPQFFLTNLIATTTILVVLAFGIPPTINWLTEKLHKDEE